MVGVGVVGVGVVGGGVLDGGVLVCACAESATASEQQKTQREPRMPKDDVISGPYTNATAMHLHTHS